MASKTQQQLNILIAKKEQYFMRIQRLYDNSKNVSTAENLEHFRVRFKTFDESVSHFLDALDEINILQYELNAKFVPDYQVLDVLDEMICNIKLVAEKHTIVANPNSAAAPKIENKIAAPNLPSLPLPSFSGQIQDWPLFIECFNNMIHNNKNLNNTDKVYYLIGCMSGTAVNVCAGIPPTGDNYSIIYQALVDKYDDKRSLANFRT